MMWGIIFCIHKKREQTDIIFKVNRVILKMESHVVPSMDVASNERITSAIKEYKSDVILNDETNMQHNKEESFDMKMNVERNDKVCIPLINFVTWINY